MSSNEKKSETLGMPHGTATHRLRKNILFHLLKKHGENYCFKCNELIETVEDLSIEHKEPWEGISAELFWDLENVAFSHLHCNRPHRFNVSGLRNQSDRKGFCIDCKSRKDRNDFHGNVSTTDGLSNVCKVCKSKRNAERVR